LPEQCTVVCAGDFSMFRVNSEAGVLEVAAMTASFGREQTGV
jgi:hypothetical protein